jgi:hypothetical protein
MVLNSAKNSVGQAIIIAAGGSDNNTLYKFTNEYTQRFYRLLKERGFKDEEINLDLRLEEELLDYPFYPF